jgi:hypothetical protein
MEVNGHNINRRELIKKSAVAGAVVWSAPVIESVTSRAAAASGRCTSMATFSASYVFVVFTYMGTTYFTGTNGGTCGNQGTSNHGPLCVSCGTVAYNIQNFSGGPATGDITYGATCADATAVGAPGAVYVGPATCGQYVTVSGGTVSAAQPGVQIVAAFCFGAGSLKGVCASTESPQGCAYANCE